MQRRKSTRGMIPLLATLAVVISSPLPAAADNTIPFYVTNETNEKLCVYCNGPWARNSFGIGGYPYIVPSGGTHKQFYYAKINVFSPFGNWTCNYEPTYIGKGLFCDKGDVCCNDEDYKHAGSVNFCLDNIPTAEVDLKIHANRSMTVNFLPSCN